MSSDDFTENPENMAICSMICGLAGMFLVITGFFPLVLAGLGLGLVAVNYGVKVLRGAAANKKLAVTGTVTGTIALTFTLIYFVARTAVFIWNLF